MTEARSAEWPTSATTRVLGEGREAARAFREELERLREVARRCAALSQSSAESEFEEVMVMVREVTK